MTHLENTSETHGFEHFHRADAAGARPWVVASMGAAFLLVAALICADYLLNAQGRDARIHAVIELTLMAIAVAVGIVFWSRFVLLRRRQHLLTGDLDRARADAERWRREANDHLRGLGVAIDGQFERWQLSSAEREVALLILKGLALKEIADVRETSERTVRQQALSVYRKAGLSGRAELSAFFLEDLLLPTPRPAPRGA
jgi:DNA-binding CsgD family transcriptional regulator